MIRGSPNSSKSSSPACASPCSSPSTLLLNCKACYTVTAAAMARQRPSCQAEQRQQPPLLLRQQVGSAWLWGVLPWVASACVSWSQQPGLASYCWLCVCVCFATRCGVVVPVCPTLRDWMQASSSRQPQHHHKQPTASSSHSLEQQTLAKWKSTRNRQRSATQWSLQSEGVGMGLRQLMCS